MDRLSSAVAIGLFLVPGGGAGQQGDHHNLAPVDPQAVLAQVVSMPISTWSYGEQDPSVRHMGPTALDFHAAFGLGLSDDGVYPLDPGGVALAAIQGLDQAMRKRDAALEERLAARDAGLAALQAELRAVTARLNQVASRGPAAAYPPEPISEAQAKLNALITQSLQHYRAGEYQECIAVCEIVLDLEPRSALAYNNIGAAYLSLGEYAQVCRATKLLPLPAVLAGSPAQPLTPCVGREESCDGGRSESDRGGFLLRS